ncbi:Endo-1,6-beta-D-glucanase neg1 [Gnomoniopsis smithogilvyi]|uniref:glucan endo-1,6-beta-glucosidase n=1 Tax=Gnomoniopsis smithogilvyi TaxID=1191159 RepID=A0A9W9CW04_9PEZI|nr:Endo-1,6-beta-D-glucanase neg1 [Gnomoniopsis smithogilvyi]
MTLSRSAIAAAAVLTLSVSKASPVEQRDGTAASYCSSSDGTYALTSFDAPVSGTGDASNLSTWQLSVDDTSSGYKQKITGFGAAVTDATVAVFNSLSDDKLSELLDTLLTSSGADFGLLRHTIGSSDLSADPAYSYDDNGGNVDTSGSGFNLGDRGYAMAGLLAKMRSIKSSLTILGSPWSAPGWMKLNGVLSGTTVNNNLNPDYRSNLADYFVDYLKAYAGAGATIDAISIQNEPLYSTAGYPTMYVYADESGDIISQNVGPALRNAGLDTQVWAYDHNTDVPDYPQTVLNEASSYVPAVAWHCYANPLDWSVLTDFHANNTDILQYMTECWTSPETSWYQAADFTMGPLQNWASGAMAWTLGSDTSYGPHLSSGGCTTCRGLVVVDTSAGTYSLAIDYYMMAQFSKFIPTGATILDGTGSYTYGDGTGIQSVASLNPDGSKTVVITNKFGNDVYVTVSLESGKTWSGRVYQNSVVTWVLPA